jgi:hypothetical protein
VHFIFQKKWKKRKQFLTSELCGCQKVHHPILIFTPPILPFFLPHFSIKNVSKSKNSSTAECDKFVVETERERSLG